MRRRSPVSPGMARLLRAAMWAFIGYTLIHHGFVRPAGFLGDDYVKHWWAARALLEGRSPYVGEHLEFYFNYPQALAWLYVWLGWFPIATAEKLWEWSHLALLAGAWWIGWRGLRPREAGPGPARAALAAHWGLAVGFSLALFGPAVENIRIGNVDPLNAILAVALAAALLGGRERLAGGCWAGLVLVKLLPAVLLAPLVMWRRWRALAVGATLLGGYALVLAATGRLGWEWEFIARRAPELPYYWRGISISPGRGLILLAGLEEWHEDPLRYRQVTSAVGLVVGVVYVAGLGWMRRRGWPLRRALEPALIGVALFSPLLQAHHFVYALPALWLQMARWAEGRMSGGFAVALTLPWLAMGVNSTMLDLAVPSGMWLRFVPPLAALVLLGVIGAELVVEGRRAQPAAEG